MVTETAMVLLSIAPWYLLSKVTNGDSTSKGGISLELVRYGLKAAAKLKD